MICVYDMFTVTKCSQSNAGIERQRKKKQDLPHTLLSASGLVRRQSMTAPKAVIDANRMMGTGEGGFIQVMHTGLSYNLYILTYLVMLPVGMAKTL